MAKCDGFRISVGDDPDHEELTAEIYFQECFVAMLSQEQGFENLQIEIYKHPEKNAWCFQLNDFLEVIELAKQRLWELRKIE
jgi:hypothetical protein